MESINKILQNKKILIIKKAYLYDNRNTEYIHVFNDEKNNGQQVEEIYKNQRYNEDENNPLIGFFLDENIDEINLYHIWKLEDFIFLSKEDYCESFDWFINFQVMENDYDLMPEYLVNYAKKYEKLSNKQEELENKGLHRTDEYKKNEEEIQKLLTNAQKRTYKETYKGERIVIILKK